MVKINKRRALDWFGDESRWEELRENIPAAGRRRLSEVADLMVFLASPRAGLHHRNDRHHRRRHRRRADR